MSFMRRYVLARGLSHERNTARTASISCFLGSCGNSSPRGLLVVVLKEDDQLAHIVCVELVVHLDALLLLDWSMKVSKVGLGQLHNDVREHLDEAAVGVAREARVVWSAWRPRLADLVVHAEVEDGVPSCRAWTRARARAHGNQQRIFRIAEVLTGDLFEFIEVLKDLLLNVRIDRLAVLIIHGCRPRW